MNRFCFRDLRAIWPSETVGSCINDLPAQAAITNQAQETLLFDPTAPDEGFWGGWATMRFNVTVGVTCNNRFTYITTPRDVARLIVMDVCKQPIRIHNGFFEYLQFGAGLQPSGCDGRNACSGVMAAYERDNVATLREPLATPSYIRIYPLDPADSGKLVLVQGNDTNGRPVTSTDATTGRTISGEYLQLQTPFAQTTNIFSTITGFQKTETLGILTIYQVDPTTGDQTQVSSMDWNEKSASYRRYLLNGLPNGCCNVPTGQLQVVCQAKLDLIPVASNSDYLTLQSLSALSHEIQATHYRKMDTPNSVQLAEYHHNLALKLLFGQLDHFLGRTQTAIRVSLFNASPVRLQPR